MNFEESLVQELTGIVVTFPMNATEGTKAPYLVYQSNEGLNDKTLSGYLVSKEVKFELDMYASSFSNLKALVPLIIAKVQSFQSRVIGTNGPYIQNITLLEPVVLWEGELKLWRSNMEVFTKF